MLNSSEIFSNSHDEVLLVSEYEDVTHCPVCNGTKRKIYIKHRNYQLLRCLHCSLVYQTPRKKELLLNEQYVGNVSSRSEYYESTFHIDKETFRERLLQTIRILKLDPKGKAVLDIGCNIGSFLSSAKELGFELIGVEPNPGAAKHCEDNGFKVIKSFFSKDTLKGMENKFDLIHLGDITEHVTNPLEVMKNVTGFAKIGGAILISTPNIDSLIARTFQIKPNEHILYFDKASLEYLVKQAGLVPLKTFVTSRKRDFKSFKYSTSFSSRRNKLILNVVRDLGIGELTMKILKYVAMDELFLIARKTA